MSAAASTACNLLATAFQDEVVTGWNSNHDLPVEWPNAVLDNTKKANKLWVRFNIVLGADRQTTLPAPTKLYRTVGVIIVQIFCPLGIGVALTNSLIDRIKDKLRGKQFGIVTTNEVTPQRIGPSQGSDQTNVTINFWFDDSST